MSAESTVGISLRGLPEWLIRQYLEELGAAPVEGSDEMAAESWSASWTSRDAELPGGTLRLTQFDIEFSAPAETVDQLVEDFMKKAQRGGG